MTPERRTVQVGDFEVRLNPDQTIDEVVGTGRVHLEQMSDQSWCLIFGDQDVHVFLEGPLWVHAIPLSPEGLACPPPFDHAALDGLDGEEVEGALTDARAAVRVLSRRRPTLRERIRIRWGRLVYVLRARRRR